MTNMVQPKRASPKRKAPKKKRPSLSTGGLKGLLIVGSAAATYFGANMIAQVEMMQAETAVEPAPIIVSQPIILEPIQLGETSIVNNLEPIPQVIIPDPITSSQSSR